MMWWFKVGFLFTLFLILANPAYYFYEPIALLLPEYRQVMIEYSELLWQAQALIDTELFLKLFRAVVGLEVFALLYKHLTKFVLGEHSPA